MENNHIFSEKVHFFLDFFTVIIYRILMKPETYFLKPLSVSQKQYEALRSFFIDKLAAAETAQKFGYTTRAVNSLVADFRKIIKNISPNEDPFFQIKKKGRKERPEKDELSTIIVELRKKNFSVPDIKVVLDSKGFQASEKYIYLVLRKMGFSRLPRRTKLSGEHVERPKIKADKSISIDCASETFSTNLAGIFSFLPCFEQYAIIKAIADSSYPQTRTIDRVSSIMAFQALKLSNIRRYSTDDLWCMDRGLGLFASLNVLPKAAWYSSYSHRVTREMNLSFLKSLHKIWRENGLLGDTSNLDFVTVPYWGDDTHFENNWSGKRRHSLASMLSVLAQDPDSGIIDYGDANILHKDKNAVVLEFLNFYQADNPEGGRLKYLVFDSKFTTYENLNRLDEKGIKFVTIRIRGKNIVEEIEKKPRTEWKKVRVIRANGKGRTLYVNDQSIILKGYSKEKPIRQIAITGHGKIKPALVITNEFDLKTEELIRKYSRRWLVEKGIAEQTDFFHLNRVSSSMVIKVDFDLTMTILAHNLYRLFALDLGRYSHLSDVRLFEKFISNSGEIEIKENIIEIKLKKKRDLPLLLETMAKYQEVKMSWLNDKRLVFSGLSHS